MLIKIEDLIKALDSLPKDMMIELSDGFDVGVQYDGIVYARTPNPNYYSRGNRIYLESPAKNHDIISKCLSEAKVTRTQYLEKEISKIDAQLNQRVELQAELNKLKEQ